MSDNPAKAVRKSHDTERTVTVWTRDGVNTSGYVQTVVASGTPAAAKMLPPHSTDDMVFTNPLVNVEPRDRSPVGWDLETLVLWALAHAEITGASAEFVEAMEKAHAALK